MMLEIPQLLEGRVDYFDLCLFAVIKAQVLVDQFSLGSYIYRTKIIDRLSTTVNAALVSWPV